MTQCSGKCLCGDVKYSVEVEKKEVGACHCDMCRIWSAGPLIMVHGMAAPKVEDETKLGVYRSSEWGERCFCKNCGTSLFWRAIDGRFFGVSASTLDDASDFKMVNEIFVDRKPAYYQESDDMTRMTAAEFWAMVQAEQGGGVHAD